ncbi:MAG: IS701 family transposase [Terriglobia bacterium]
MAEAARHLDLESYEKSIPQLTVWQIKSTLEDFDRFVKRYDPFFYRKEQRGHFRTELRGLLSDLPRKTIEPIAFDHKQPDHPLQHFVGAGLWDDEKVLAEFHEHVVEEFGDPDGVLVVDGSGFPKKGTESVGVKRQYCGRTGKIDNCQVGVFLGYASPQGGTLVGRRLYFPREWARSPKRRRKAHVPDDVRYRSTIQISNEMLQHYGSRFPHGWITGDDEFGRITWFRYALADRGERYLLEVPTDTHIRDLDAVPPKRPSRLGPPTKPPFLPVLAWAKAQPRSSWTRLQIRDGEKRPLEVEAILARVQCRFERRVGREETLLVTRTIGPNPEYKAWLGNPRLKAPIEKLAWVASMRHRIEEFIEWGKQDAGLAAYEVRSWVGWHHHMTLSLLALGFLTLEHKRLEKKEANPHRLDGCSRG